MSKKIQNTLIATCLSLSTGIASASIINFSFTGRLTVEDTNGFIIQNSNDRSINDGYQTAIAANLVYDTELGIGSSNLNITGEFWDEALSVHDINLDFQEGSNNIEGSMLTDWGSNLNMQMQTMWDATGLINAIDIGLEAGDRISGTNLYRDSDGDGYAETFIGNVNSATPVTDFYVINDNYLGTLFLDQGPAPLAMTAETIGLIDGPFPGFKIHLDIGSGNSLHVTSVSAVPVPAAIWLFVSGLIGIAGFARRRNDS